METQAIFVIILFLTFIAVVGYWGGKKLYLLVKYGFNPIKVGILHSFTGTMAVSEPPVAKASLMAIDEINMKGGILGRKIRPILANGKSTPEVFAKQAEKLITRYKVSVVFGLWNSHSRKQVKPIFEKYNHLLIYPMAYEGLEQSNSIIYTGGIPNQIIIPAIKWIMETQGKKRFFLIGSDYIGPHTSNAIIKDQINIYNGKIVGEAYVPLGALDFSESIKKIIAAKPDVIINNINGQGNIAFYKELRSQGVTIEDVTIISFNMGDVELQEIKAENAVGDYAVWNYFQAVANETNQHFVREYRARYGDNVAIGDTVEAGYFGVYIWAQAVEKAQTDDVVQVKESIKGQKFRAPCGVVRIDRDNQHTWKSARIAQVRKDGKFHIVWMSEAPIPPIPYPSYRTREEWENYLNGLYIGWGNNWYHK